VELNPLSNLLFYSFLFIIYRILVLEFLSVREEDGKGDPIESYSWTGILPY